MIRKQHPILPVVVIFCIHNTSQEFKVLTYDCEEMPFCKRVHCHGWAQKCYFIRAAIISAHLDQQPLHPWTALGHFFFEQKLSILDMMKKDEPTIKVKLDLQKKKKINTYLIVSVHFSLIPIHIPCLFIYFVIPSFNKKSWRSIGSLHKGSKGVPHFPYFIATGLGNEYTYFCWHEMFHQFIYSRSNTKGRFFFKKEGRFFGIQCMFIYYLSWLNLYNYVG